MSLSDALRQAYFLSEMKKAEDLNELMNTEMEENIFPIEVQAEKLKDALNVHQPKKFKVGDYVTLEDNSPLKRPKNGSIAIVSEVFDAPKTADIVCDGTPLFREDTVIHLNSSGEWVFYKVDSRYLKKVEI